MASSLLNGIALVTGAASGIGEETVYALAEHGVRGVVLADIDLSNALKSAESSKKFATNPEYRAVAVSVDITDPQSVKEMTEFVVKEFGRIDYCINCAGIVGKPLPISDVDIDAFDRIMAVNTRGTMLCIREVTRVMKEQELKTFKNRHGIEISVGRGSIVVLGSSSSYGGGPAATAYTASKHAVLGMVKVAALDNAKHQIRVNALCPSWVETPMLENILERSPALGKLIELVNPAGRAARPEEVANVAVFLCSQSATYINGTGLLIDAGMLVTAAHTYVNQGAVNPW